MKYKAVIECDDDTDRFLASDDLADILEQINDVGWRYEQDDKSCHFYWKQYPEGQDFLEELSYPWEEAC